MEACNEGYKVEGNALGDTEAGDVVNQSDVKNTSSPSDNVSSGQSGAVIDDEVFQFYKEAQVNEVETTPKSQERIGDDIKADANEKKAVCSNSEESHASDYDSIITEVQKNSCNEAYNNVAVNTKTCSELDTNSICLFDLGAQYLDGITNITRTVHIGKPSEYGKACYTAVLKGHIALENARFPNGDQCGAACTALSGCDKSCAVDEAIWFQNMLDHVIHRVLLAYVKEAGDLYKVEMEKIFCNFVIMILGDKDLLKGKEMLCPGRFSETLYDTVAFIKKRALERQRFGCCAEASSSTEFVKWLCVCAGHFAEGMRCNSLKRN